LADLVHTQYNTLADESHANPASILSAKPGASDYGLVTRSLGRTDAARTFKCYYTAAAINSNTTEALISLTPTSDFVTGTAGTAFTVPAGKTFRPQYLGLSGRIATATSPPAWGAVRMRAVASGSVSATSPVVAGLFAPLRAITAVGIGVAQGRRFDKGEADVLAGGQWGISFVTASGTAARTVWEVYLIGYEF
jgi:hypothetical protein